MEAAAADAPTRAAFSIVCLSSQRWTSSLPTNRQQIMTRVARRGHQVLFVETSDFIARRVVVNTDRFDPAVNHDVAGVVEVTQLQKIAPFSQRSSVANSINFRFGTGPARRAAARLDHPRVLWIYDPRGAAAIGRFGEDLVVYDCVDDYGEQVGDSRRARRFISRLDREVAARADLVFTTTDRLRTRHDRARGGVHLVPNVGDYEHFHAAADRATADPELLELPRPVLGFAGNLTTAKVDFELIEKLAEAFPAATILLVGPVQADGEEHVRRLLAAHPNVRSTGLRPYPRLPAAVAAFDVGLIPYAVNEYTRSVFPLKVYEYLAAGKPVVAAGVPSMAGLKRHVTLAHDPDAFVAAVAKAVDEGDAGKDARMAIAAANTWDHRAGRLLDLIDAELQRARPRRD